MKPAPLALGRNAWMMAAAGLYLAAADAPAQPSARAAVGVAVREVKVISHDPHYHGWPTVALRRNGELVLTYSGGRDFHVCPFGRIEMMSSRDGGATWSWPRVLMDSVTDDRDSGALETSKGTLLVTFFTSVAYQQHLNAPDRLLTPTFGAETPALVHRWKLADRATTPEEKQNDVGYWMLRSSDGGPTWSARYAVPGYSPHGPTELADGRLFYAAADGKKAGAYLSDDDGLTWKLIADLPVRAGEMHAVQAADGALIVHVRDKQATSKGRVQNTAQTVSTDGGRTWSAPRPVADGYPSHLLRLHDQTLLMTYGWRQSPYGIRGKISRDHGRSWSNEFILYRDGANADLGYPSTVQLADGSLLSVWYEVLPTSRQAVLRQAKWTLTPLSG